MQNRAFRNDLTEIARFLSMTGDIAGNMPELVEQNEISGIFHALYPLGKGLCRMAFFVIHFTIILIFSLLAVAAMLWIRHRVGTDKLRRNHEVAGFVYSVIGAIFAVTVALVVDTVHDEYLTGERVASTEAIQVAALYQLSGWFPGSGDMELKQNLLQYARNVVNKEWERTVREKDPASPETEAAFQAVVKSVQTLTPATFQQQTVYSEMVRSLSVLREYRYTRLYGRQENLPPPLWIAVILGGAITIGFTLFFSMESRNAHMAVVFALSVLIWSNIIVISQVHYPFNGFGITPPRALIEWLARM